MYLRGAQVVGAEYLLSEKELSLTGFSGKPKIPWVISENTPAAHLILEPRMLFISVFYSESRKGKN